MKGEVEVRGGEQRKNGNKVKEWSCRQITGV